MFDWTFKPKSRQNKQPTSSTNSESNAVRSSFHGTMMIIMTIHNDDYTMLMTMMMAMEVSYHHKYFVWTLRDTVILVVSPLHNEQSISEKL